MKTMKLKVSIITTVIALVVIASFGASQANAQFSTNAKNLAGLIAVDSIATSNSGGAFTSGTDNLGELIVLGGLFPTSRNATQNAKDLAGLIAVDNILGNGSGGSFTSGGTTDLGGLLVLNNLFLDP